MTKRDMAIIISNSKYNDKHWNYSFNELMRMNEKDLGDLYETFLKDEYKAILNNNL